jgi:hypothetical protein
MRLGAMHLNSYPQLTGLIRELKGIGNSTRVWWRVWEEGMLSRENKMM